MFSVASGVAEGWSRRALNSWARRRAQLSPAGPAPTIRTSVSRVSRSTVGITVPSISYGKWYSRLASLAAHHGPSLEVRSSIVRPLLGQAGDLLLQRIRQRGVGSELLRQVPIDLPRQRGLGGPLSVGLGHQGHGLGHSHGRVIGALLIELDRVRRPARPHQFTGLGELGQRGDVRSRSLSGLLQCLDGGCRVTHVRLAYAKEVEGDLARLPAPVLVGDLFELRQGFLVARLNGGEGVRRRFGRGSAH